MRQLTASEARANIDRLMDEAATTHEPILITGKRHNAVLISHRISLSLNLHGHLGKNPPGRQFSIRRSYRSDSVNEMIPFLWGSPALSTARSGCHGGGSER